MSRLLFNIMSIFETGNSSSFLGASLFWKFVGTGFSWLWSWIKSLLYHITWYVVQFIFGIMEAFEFMINQFLGIGTTVNDMYNYLSINDQRFLSVLSHTLRAIFAVSLLLIIIFTIFSLIRQDWKNAFDDAGSGSNAVRNDKKIVVIKAFKNIIIMFMLPIIMLILISGVNSVLTSFSVALKQGADVTVAGEVLASSTYDTNRYRQYAEAGRRIPITISAYNVDEFASDQNDMLEAKIKDVKVQQQLLDTATMYADGSFLTFKDSLEYKNNMLINSTNYGDYYEKFICTPEQYQIMAEFVDYAELHNLDFYIKAIDEHDIDWRYVDSSVFDANTNSLKISYRDANDLNNNNDINDSYTITYQMSYNVTSPISDALKSLLALLGIDEYEDDLWKVMERQEDSVNLVNWANEKVLIKLSEDFDYANKSTWTDTDQVIMYEYYHYEIDNNTLGKYEVQDLMNGVELDAYQIVVNNFDNGLYIGDSTIDCVLINDNYYRVELSDTETDFYGNKYYVLSSIEGGNFLENSYTTIENVKSGDTNVTTKIAFSSGFDIHKPDTWTFGDQILIYEYYRYSTNLGAQGPLGQGSDSNVGGRYLSSYYSNRGVDFYVYKIEQYRRNLDGIFTPTESGYYVKLNQTYYKVNENNGYKLFDGDNKDKNFLNITGQDITTYYAYQVADESKFGLDSGLITESNGREYLDFDQKMIYTNISEANFDSEYEKYFVDLPNEEARQKIESLCERFTQKGYKLTEGFDFTDVSTWTYRDFFLYYLYLSYTKFGNDISIEGLKLSGMPGKIGYITGGDAHAKEFVISVPYTNSTGVITSLYLPLEKVMNVSEDYIMSDLDVTSTFNSNRFYSIGDDPLFFDNNRLGGYDIYANPMVTHVFNLTSGFSASTVSNWTVGDMILYALSIEGNIQSLSRLQTEGYMALVYEQRSDGEVINNTYRFGSSGNPLYISDAQVRGLKSLSGKNLNISSVEDWFAMPLLDFVCLKYDIERSSLYSELSGIISSIYSGNYSSHRKYSDDVISEILAENGINVIDNPDFIVTTNVQNYVYTRSSSYREDNLETWTYLDMVLYYLNEKSAGNNDIVVSVINYNGSNYLVYNNKCVLLDRNIGLTSEYSIISSANNVNINTLIHQSTDADFAEILGTLYLYLDQDFTYTYTGADTNLLERVLRNIYEINGMGGELTSGKGFNFRIYTTLNGLNKYIKLTLNNRDYYITLASGQIYFRNESTLSVTASAGLGGIPLHKGTNTYTSFSGSNYSFMDAICYYYTGNEISHSYDIYSSSGSDSFIVINGHVVRYFASMPANRSADNFVSDVKNLFGSNQTMLNTVIENLYLYYQSNISNSTRVDNSTLERCQLSINFKVNDISTWSPLEIILYYLDLIDESSTMFEGNFVKDALGNKYFEIKSNTYIKINDLCNTQEDMSTSDHFMKLSNSSFTTDISIRAMYYNIILTTNPQRYSSNRVTSVDDIDTVTTVVNNVYNDFKNTFIARSLNLNGSGLVTTYVKNMADVQSKNIVSTEMILSDPSTWSYFSMFYYQMTGRLSTSVNSFYVYSGNNERYVAVTQTIDGSATFYFKISQNKNISRISSRVESFDGGLDQLTPLAVIIYYLTGRTSANVVKYQISNYSFDYFQLPTGDYVAITGIGNEKLDYASSDAIYSYEMFAASSTRNDSDAFTWDLFEYLLLYDYGSITNKKFNSRIYYIAGYYYFGFGQSSDGIERYINITNLINTENMHYDATSKKVVAQGSSTDLAGYLKSNDKLNFAELARVKNYTPDNYWESQALQVERFELSENFVLNNPLTWTLRDFIIYYMYSIGGYFDGIENFEEIINYGFGAIEGYVINQDNYGNVSYHHILCFTSKTENYKKLTNYVYYDTFIKLATSQLANYSTVLSNDVRIDITLKGASDAPSGVNRPSFFSYRVTNSSAGLPILEYYYYRKNAELWGDDKFINGTLTTDFKNAIMNNDFSYYNLTESQIELKFSNGFDISRPETWTVKDAIILVEYANTSVGSNEFDTGDFAKLVNEGITTNLYADESRHIGGFILNGTVYNYYFMVQEGNEEKYYDINTNMRTLTGNKDLLIQVDDSSSNIDVFYQTLKFTINYDSAQSYSPSNSYLPHQEGNKSVYFNLDSNMYMQYQILVDLLNVSDPNKPASPLVREVNWPQKLINDMQVLYPDLNWNTLLATKGWLDTLGDFSSAYTSGTYISEGNSSNITAAGLVLSEFFLSIAEETENSDLSRYTYKSIFDEDTIKALMLAMLGEYEYENVYLQAKIFMDMFNSMFAPVLDDIAAETGGQIMDGQVEDLTMCVYKSYLATVLLGSDMGEYFYKIATRVYAQYTIYESFAIASGDYANYYAYINNERGEDGQVVKSFMYSTFRDLVIYENQQAGVAAPTFTFNYNNAFQKYKYQLSLSGVESDPSFTYFDRVLECLDKDYSNIYSRGERIGENDGLYCYMLDAYWQIYHDVGGSKNLPIYAEIYHEYIMGNLGRWETISNADITNMESSIKYYRRYQVNLLLAKCKLILNYLKVYLSLNISVREDENTEEFNSALEKELGDKKVEMNTPYGLMKSVFETGTLANIFKETFPSIENLLNVKNTIAGIIETSEGGSDANARAEAWKKLNDYYDNVGKLIQELSDVMKNPTSAVTENGSTKQDYDDKAYDKAYDKLQELQSSLENYISTQKKLDGIAKACITFTLKEYGQNYVPEGYKINIGNRSFALRSATTSTRRLAEYVYGGEFLVNYGIYPEFTSDEFDGFITTAKEYDSDMGIVRTRLNVWSDLRKFASSLADYTSRLYFLSNFNDLSSNVSDAVYLTDYVQVRGENTKVTIEQMIINYLIDPGEGESKLSTDTLMNIIYKDTLPIVTSMIGNYNGNKQLVNQLAEYAQSRATDASFTENTRRDALKEYVAFVASNAYTSQGRYSGATQSDRIHEMFKSVISYLLINEEADEEGKKTINLDDITFKDLKMLLIKNIVEYVQNPTETAAENSARYLAIFNLISCQVNYYYLDTDNQNSQVRIGTTIGNAYMIRETLPDRDGNYVRTGEFSYKLSEGKVYSVLADFERDIASRNLVIEMARISNRPIESLVNLEYDKLYDMKGNYDEANGDTFIICYYDDYIGKYIPYLTVNNENSVAKQDRLFKEYKEKYTFNMNSEYLPAGGDSSVPMPIVAKGIIVSGKPTAIKVEDYKVKFYRSDVIATLAVDDRALNSTRFSGETNTIKYVDYVDTTVGGSSIFSRSQQANFISESDISYFVHSDINPYYIQISNAYDYAEETGRISVLDGIAIFYELKNITFIMIAIGIAATMPVLFKGTAMVLRRILDLLTLTLIGPPILAMNTLDYDEQNGSASAPAKAYTQWRDYVTQTLLSVFGYIAGLNIYYILISTITGMTFVSAQTVSTIQSIGGLSFLTSSVLNFIVKFIFIAVAAGTIETSANMVANIVSAGKVSSAFDSPMGGNAMEKVKGVLEETKKAATNIKDIYTGKAAIQAGAAALEFGKQMVPGSQVIEKGVDFAKKQKTKIEGKALEKLAEANGVPPQVAKALSKHYVEQTEKQRKAKKQAHKNNVKGFAKKHETFEFLNGGSGEKKKKNDKDAKKAEKEKKRKKKEEKKKRKQKRREARNKG